MYDFSLFFPPFLYTSYFNFKICHRFKIDIFDTSSWNPHKHSLSSMSIWCRFCYLVSILAYFSPFAYLESFHLTIINRDINTARHLSDTNFWFYADFLTQWCRLFWPSDIRRKWVIYLFHVCGRHRKTISIYPPPSYICQMRSNFSGFVCGRCIPTEIYLCIWSDVFVLHYFALQGTLKWGITTAPTYVTFKRLYRDHYPHQIAVYPFDTVGWAYILLITSNIAKKNYLSQTA